MLNQATMNQIALDLRGKKVMEVGCGTCEFTNLAAKYCEEIYAIDIENKASYLQKQPNAYFKLMDASKMEFRPMSFDVVVFYNSVGHLEKEIDQIIAESLRVLKEDGMILILSSGSYDRAVLNNVVHPNLQKLNLDVKLSQYMTTQIMRVKKYKRVGVNYKELKENNQL